MYVTLNEGYLRAASRGSKNILIFNENITYYPSMKRRFFWSVLLFFETADLRSNSGYFLAICQLWFYNSRNLICIGALSF